MKTLLNITALLFIIFSLFGCATTNTNPSQKTFSSIEAVEEHLNQITKQMGETESAIDRLSNANKSELEDAYDSFSNHVSELEEMKKEFNNLTKEMKSNSDEYITKWQSEAETYDNPQLRSGSRDRREKLNQTFNTIMDSSGDVNRSFERYLSATKEIESYLGNDLTKDAVEAVYSLSQGMEEPEDELRQAINSMQRSISDAKQEMGRTDIE